MLLGARTMSLFGERFFRQEIGKVSGPVHVEWGTIGSNPIFLRALPVEPRALSPWFLINALVGRHPGQRSRRSTAGVGFPKTVAPSGIGDIHDFHHRNPLNVNKLVQNKALYNRRNYHIII
jgi:hypothetical protein